MKQIYSDTHFDENQNLVYDNQIISLFYFRAGYSENDFPDKESWDALEKIETSSAIKCPNVNTFLCTFKIFQFVLQNEAVLERYLPEKLIADDIKRMFAKMYSVSTMSPEERKELYADMKANYTKYIVKPQKEGGGNNFYNEDILKVLPKDNSDDVSDILANSLIMERITPKEQECLILIKNGLKLAKCISEISVYGIILADKDKVYINKSAGFLIRTKESHVQEGGVVSGFSAIDIPYLV